MNEYRETQQYIAQLLYASGFLGARLPRPNQCLEILRPPRLCGCVKLEMTVGNSTEERNDTMIIDSHAYCFEPADSPRGYASSEEHLKWVQASHAVHHQPAFRIRDRAPGPSDILAPEGRRDLSNLPDVRFRINHPRGRVVWNYEGEEYTKHFYPPNLRSCEFTPFSLNAEMDYADVDMALL
ncbi:hypothetical protein J4G02_19435, partial [Candidatus Poribacteria bacterium]|nr:hypothetical protein [Candidatus Poribacteria bacterium]